MSSFLTWLAGFRLFTSLSLLVAILIHTYNPSFFFDLCASSGLDGFVFDFASDGSLPLGWWLWAWRSTKALLYGSYASYEATKAVTEGAGKRIEELEGKSEVLKASLENVTTIFQYVINLFLCFPVLAFLLQLSSPLRNVLVAFLAFTLSTLPLFYGVAPLPFPFYTLFMLVATNLSLLVTYYLYSEQSTHYRTLLSGLPVNLLAATLLGYTAWCTLTYPFWSRLLLVLALTALSSLAVYSLLLWAIPDLPQKCAMASSSLFSLALSLTPIAVYMAFFFVP